MRRAGCGDRKDQRRQLISKSKTLLLSGRGVFSRENAWLSDYGAAQGNEKRPADGRFRMKRAPAHGTGPAERRRKNAGPKPAGCLANFRPCWYDTAVYEQRRWEEAAEDFPQRTAPWLGGRWKESGRSPRSRQRELYRRRALSAQERLTESAI